MRTAGSTVTEPATAHATTAMVPLAIPLKMFEPTMNWPDIAIITVRPATSTERPTVAAVRSSASDVPRPRWRSSLKRTT